MISAKLPKIFYGVDYNPEQWPEAVWQEDVRLMREAGVNLVSVGTFSWAKLQPKEQTYDFAWFDRVMDLLAANGIYACVATATASPPAWMSTKYPDVLAVDAEGKTYYPGARQHYSPCSPTYRRLAAALVKQFAKRYAQHPALAHLVLQCSAINHIDASALESLETIAARLQEAGIALHLSEVKGPVMDRLRGTHFLQSLPGKVYMSQFQAMEDLLQADV